jgi:molybdenum cofactor cytidylyltransferase
MTQPENNSTAPPFVTALVLAAGASSRMGEPKQLLPWGGVPLVAHATRSACRSTLISETVVVVGREAASVAEAVEGSGGGSLRVVVNPDWSQGIGTSLTAGLAAASPESVAACVLLGDEPGIGIDLIDQIIVAFFQSDHPVVRPVYEGEGGVRVPGHPALIDRSLWSELETLHGDRGLRSLLETHPDWLESVLIAGAAPVDIDTPEDYQRLGEGLGATH